MDASHRREWRTATERIFLINRHAQPWLEFIELGFPEGFSDLLCQLAYLWAAISLGRSFEVDKDSPLADLMEGKGAFEGLTAPDEALWDYIEVVES